MLIAFLLLILILVILFREEIKTLIAYGIVVLISWSLWEVDALWGKIASLLLIALMIFGALANTIEKLKRDKSK
jgi:hypothetical protein